MPLIDHEVMARLGGRLHELLQERMRFHTGFDLRDRVVMGGPGVGKNAVLQRLASDRGGDVPMCRRPDGTWECPWHE